RSRSASDQVIEREPAERPESRHQEAQSRAFGFQPKRTAEEPAYHRARRPDHHGHDPSTRAATGNDDSDDRTDDKTEHEEEQDSHDGVEPLLPTKASRRPTPERIVRHQARASRPRARAAWGRVPRRRREWID